MMMKEREREAEGKQEEKEGAVGGRTCTRAHTLRDGMEGRQLRGS